MKNCIRTFAMTICHLACAVFISLVFCSVFVIMDFLSPLVGIFFFRLLVYALLASFVTAAASVFVARATRGRLKGVLNVQGIVSAFIVSALALYAFLGVTTFTNERSYTIFSLAYLYDSDRGVLSQQDMELVFVEKFVLEGGATKFRIDEQMNTGYIEAVDGGYRLSQSGRRFIELQRTINRFFPVSTDPSSLYPLGKK